MQWSRLLTFCRIYWRQSTQCSTKWFLRVGKLSLPWATCRRTFYFEFECNFFCTNICNSFQLGICRDLQLCTRLWLDSCRPSSEKWCRHILHFVFGFGFLFGTFLRKSVLVIRLCRWISEIIWIFISLHCSTVRILRIFSWAPRCSYVLIVWIYTFETFDRPNINWLSHQCNLFYSCQEWCLKFENIYFPIDFSNIYFYTTKSERN